VVLNWRETGVFRTTETSATSRPLLTSIAAAAPPGSDFFHTCHAAKEQVLFVVVRSA